MICRLTQADISCATTARLFFFPLFEQQTLFPKTGKDYAEKENLKEMGDVTSGMASTVIQVYLRSVLDSYLNENVFVRHAVVKIISLILAQGLVYPVQVLTKKYFCKYLKVLKSNVVSRLRPIQIFWISEPDTEPN